jgi:hypothetical protein
VTRPRGLLAVTTQTDRRDWVTSVRSEIPAPFLGFSRPCSQENFRPPRCGPFASARYGQPGRGADFSFASSDFKALGAFFCNSRDEGLVSTSVFSEIYLRYQLIASSTKSTTATCTNFGASIGLEPNYGARARMGGGPLLPLRRTDRDAAPRRGRERERGMGRIGAAKRGSGARHRLQAFLQAFPNLGCFSPSFSKESFGRFVGFQWVARLPNPMSPLPNILLSPGARRTRRTRPDQWGSLRAHRNTLAWMPFFRKKNRRFLFQCASTGARRPPKRRPADVPLANHANRG